MCVYCCYKYCGFDFSILADFQEKRTKKLKEDYTKELDTLKKEFDKERCIYIFYTRWNGITVNPCILQGGQSEEA